MYSLQNKEDLSKLVVSYASLRATNPVAPIGVLLSSDISEDIVAFLNQIGISPLIGTYYDEFLSSHPIVDGPARQIVLYKQFPTIIYLDLHTYILKNIDSLFGHLSGSMYHDPFNRDDFLGIFVYNTTNFNMKEAFDSDYNFHSIREEMEKWFDYEGREKLHLPIDFCTNIFRLKEYRDNPLFNMSSTKILVTYNPKLELTEQVDLYDFPTEIQPDLAECIRQYNLIINVYKRLYPNMADKLNYAQYRF